MLYFLWTINFLPSLCIIYLMVALGNWVSVPIVSVFGSKWSLVISGALYVWAAFFVAMFVSLLFILMCDSAVGSTLLLWSGPISQHSSLELLSLEVLEEVHVYMKKNNGFVLNGLICFVVVLWTAQGQILIQNSSKDKMGTTSGIFWFMLQQRYMYMYMYIIMCTRFLKSLLLWKVTGNG